MTGQQAAGTSDLRRVGMRVSSSSTISYPVDDNDVGAPKREPHPKFAAHVPHFFAGCSFCP